MKRILGWIGSLTILFVALSAPPAQASIDDFSYESWDVKYELSLDSEGRALARVTETLVPIFPEHDQNRGIVRALPLKYEGAPAAPRNVSIYDGEGNPVPFTIEEDDTFRAILVGDDSYVHGRQEWIISYTLNDVMLAATETKVDEFYWDILPLERKQPVDRFTATVSLSDELANALTGDAACYYGAANSTDMCAIDTPETGVNEIHVAPMEMLPGQGVTIAIAFEPGTAVQPPVRTPNPLLDVGPSVLGGASLVASILGTIFFARYRRKRKTHRGVVVAQYDVPANLPPLIAAPIVGEKRVAVPAQFIHLAVLGAMRIEEPEEENGRKKRKSDTKFFRLVDPSNTGDPLDTGMLNILFPGLPPNQRFRLPRASTSFASKMSAQEKLGLDAAMARGYLTYESSRAGRLFGLLGIACALIAGVLIYQGLGRDQDTERYLAIGLAIVGGYWALKSLRRERVHTPLGAEAYEYLQGVREFIRVAEADRLQMLQSYTGADRLPDGSVNVIHIYEKLLPYAIVFGLEKEWGKTLQVYYEQQSVSAPVWYPGIMATKSGGNIGSEMRSFTSTVSSSASYTSSSSGGSSGGGGGGGGFSGGGGGGGFSGGR